MTVKALKRQLMAAIAMIMVSLIALSSSTYAWFTMNKTVTASGLTVKARTEGGIQIKRTKGGTGSDSAQFASSSTQQLLPTSTADGMTWAHAAAVGSSTHNADEKTYTLLNTTANFQEIPANENSIGFGTIGGTSTKTYYYVFDEFTITRDSNSKSFTDLYVSEVTASKTNGSITPLSSSLRVLVKCVTKDQGTKYYIFAPVADATKEYQVVTNIATSGTTVNITKETVTALLSADSANQPLTLQETQLYSGEVESLDGLNVTVYVYFEGEDDRHTTNNISAAAGVLDELNITLKFSCSSVTPK